MAPSSEPARSSRAHPLAVALALTLVAAAWLGWPLAFHGMPGWFSDCSAYLFLADHFRGQSIAPEFAAEMWGVTRFPPGFPLAIALAGGDTLHPFPALVLTTACAVAAVATLAAWFAVRSRSAVAGFALGIALLASPELFVRQLDAVSEPLFMLLLGIALLAAERRGEAERGWAREAILVAALAALPFVRAVGVVFLAAHALARIFGSRGAWPNRVALATMPIVPFWAWWVLRAASSNPESYASSFETDPVGAMSGGHVSFILAQLQRLAEATAGLFAFSPGPVATSFAYALLAAGFVGACTSAWRREFAGISLLAYTAAVVIWPYPAEFTRLLLVALPLGLALASDAVALLPPVRPRHAAFAGAIVAALVFVFELPAVSRILARGTADVAPELGPYRTVPSYWRIEQDAAAKTVLELHATIDGALLELADAVPAGECVYSTNPMLLASRSGVAVDVYPFDLKSVDDARTRLRRCRYHFVSYVSSTQYHQSYLYPQDYIQPWVDPVFVSRFDRNGVPTIAVVLAKARDAAAATR